MGDAPFLGCGWLFLDSIVKKLNVGFFDDKELQKVGDVRFAILGNNRHGRVLGREKFEDGTVLFG